MKIKSNNQLSFEAGTTYLTHVGSSSFFNIDAGGGYTGVFLDSLRSYGARALTVDFDTTANAFGFDTSNLMGTDFDVVINFTDGSAFIQNFLVIKVICLI